MIIVFVGIWFAGIIPENVLPNPQGILNEAGMGGTGSALSEDELYRIDELEFRLTSLEDEFFFLIDEGTVGEKGEPGDRGPQGFRGEVGPQGTQGIQGPSTIPMIFSIGERSTEFFRPIFLGHGLGNENYDLVKVLVPVDANIKNLTVLATKDPGIVVEATLIKNGIETDLSCQLDSSNSCSDNRNLVFVSAGDVFAIKFEKATSLLESERVRVQASIIFEPIFEN